MQTPNNFPSEKKESQPYASGYFQTYLLQTYPTTFKQTQNQDSFDYTVYFNALFSPRETAESIKKRNENMYNINFQNSDSEPDDIYTKRRDKMSKLEKNQQSQLETMNGIKNSDFPKYKSMVMFMKFFYEIKKKINGIRTDYYSTKTFCAIKNSTEADLIAITNLSRGMYNNIMKLPRIFFEFEEFSESQLDNRDLEFLILPRFLISKEKIARFVRDQKLRDNFEFLIQNQCLGHYNNEANKKMPEEFQMKLIKDLLKRSKGREKFRKICSINHGSRFLKDNGNVYYQLYTKSFTYLKYLDTELKKKKKYEKVKEQLEKIPIQTEESENSQNESQESSSHKISFKGFHEALNCIEKSEQPRSLHENEQQIEMSKKVKKLLSTPLGSSKTSFKVKKSLTDEMKIPNIILVKPPKEI